MTSASASRSVFQKIIAAHVAEEEIVPGRTIEIRIDQTLTRDVGGTLCYLEFEAMGLDRVATELSVSYAEAGSTSNPEDHAYLESVAARHGIHFSRVGNGPAHLVHLARFAVPGKTLLGADRRTVACGGLGMLALPASGLNVAIAMGGGPFHLRCPEVVQVFLRGRLRPLVGAPDLALELLRRRSAKSGAGKVFEFSGPGVRTLPIENRATIALLAGELGALTTVFPSDDRSRSFLQGQRRVKAHRRLEADPHATFDDREEIDLGTVEPMIFGPEPIRIRPVREVSDTPLREAIVGVDGHTSARDLVVLAAVLKGREVRTGVSLVVCPGPLSVRRFGEHGGALDAIVSHGAKVRDSVDAKAAGGVLLLVAEPGGRGGSDPLPCLASVETAAASAVHGEITDPRTLKRVPKITPPRRLQVDDSLLVRAQKEPSKVEVRRSPHLAPLPPFAPMPTDLSGRVLLKLGDEISGAHILPPSDNPEGDLANLPALAEGVFSSLDPEFARRAKEWGGGCVVASHQYGAGTSSEHAALAPRLLGMRFVLARSFWRPHLVDLVHFGIVPLVFANGRDYEAIAPGDDLHVPEAATRLKVGRPVIVENRSSGRQLDVRYELSDREREILVEGGLLAFTRRRARKGKEARAA